MEKRKCIHCEKDYNCEDTVKYNREMSEYVRYLGACNEECFYKLPRSKRNRLMFGAFLQWNKSEKKTK
tara:strand:+ start:2639 stop:2842 length:204 start_codon:yes stop_codon:yes gene_type:complete